MGRETEIHWSDSTVNPTSGCDGCELWTPGKGGPCYAGNYHEGRMAKALPQLYSASFNDVKTIAGRMSKAAGWADLRGTDRPSKPWMNGMPRLIFVGDMGDVMSADVPFEYLKAELIDVARSAKGRRHVWQLLTKQPYRLKQFAAWLRGMHDMDWPSNVWVGTSVTSQSKVSRVRTLAKMPAAVRFVSAEPLMEAVDIPLDGIAQVIVGGESGPGARPFNVEWARDIVRQCKAAGVACFVKQMGASARMSFDEWVNNWMPHADAHGFTADSPGADAGVWRGVDRKGGDMAEWAEDLRVREFPSPA